SVWPAHVAASASVVSYSSSSACRKRGGGLSRQCRRECSSGSGLRRRSSAHRGCCCSTSRRVRSIRSGGGPYASCSKSCNGASAHLDARGRLRRGRGRRGLVTAIWTIAEYGLREALRRKVFVVVCFLTIAFLGLYWLGARYAFHHVAGVVPPEGVDARTFAGAFLFGMAMFGTLFLGVVLAIFLTLGTVRGDAERALLQPLVVRPIGRAALLVARFLGAAAVCVPYVLILYFAAMLLTGLEGSWWPDRIVTPGLELA